MVNHDPIRNQKWRLGVRSSMPYCRRMHAPRKRKFLTIAFLVAVVCHFIGAAQDQDVKQLIEGIKKTEYGREFLKTHSTSLPVPIFYYAIKMPPERTFSPR